MQTALLIIDVQQDFCPGGSLSVHEGDRIISGINMISPNFKTVIATRDWHPASHISFAANHPGKAVYDSVEVNNIRQVLWPVHCQAGSPGADFHSDLDTSRINLILHKGTNPLLDSYSAFYENDHTTPTGLEGYLKGLGIDSLVIGGLATDYCVFFTVMDALTSNYKVQLLQDCIRGVNIPEGSVEQRIDEMVQAGARLADSREFT